MGEDRRPNVAGRTEEDPPRTSSAADEERRRVAAKALRQRSAADGHEGPSPAEPRDQKDER